MELLEKQNISVKDLTVTARSEIYLPSFDGAFQQDGLIKINKSDEVKNDFFNSNNESYPGDIKLQGSLECVWNLFDGSILYPTQHNASGKEITACEANHQQLGMQRRKAHKDVNSESGKKQRTEEENINSQSFSLNSHDISLSADIFLQQNNDNFLFKQ